jgi:site-specific recombinase XerD
MSIKEMLGHASLESTAIYLHIEMSSLKAAVGQHPLVGLP